MDAVPLPVAYICTRGNFASSIRNPDKPSIYEQRRRFDKITTANFVIYSLSQLRAYPKNPLSDARISVIRCVHLWFLIERVTFRIGSKWITP